MVGFFLLPLGINPSTPFFIAAIILGIVQIFRTRTCNRRDLVFLSYPILIVIMFISLSYSTNVSEGLNRLERSLPLLFFPLVLMFIKEDKVIVLKLFKALLFGILISLCINLYLAFSNSITIENGQMVFDSSVATGYSFMESFRHGGSHFIGGEFSQLIHPSYLALYILSTAVFFYNKKLGRAKFIVYTILFLYLFLLASRGAFVIMLVLLVLYVFAEGTLRQKMVKGVLLVFLGIAMFNLNPRIKIFYERLVDFTQKKNFNYTTSEQSRILIYQSSWQLVTDAPLFGYGVGDANDKLQEVYLSSGYLKNSEDKYNAHNQYFQTMLQTGAIGLGFLLLPFLTLLYRTRNVQMFSMIVVLGGSLLFESMFVRYNGILFYAIIIPFLLREKQVVIDEFRNGKGYK